MPFFKVNDYVELKLKGCTTEIYVKGQPFKQCKKNNIDLPNSLEELYINHNNIKNLTNLKEIGKFTVFRFDSNPIIDKETKS